MKQRVESYLELLFLLKGGCNPLAPPGARVETYPGAHSDPADRQIGLHRSIGLYMYVYIGLYRSIEPRVLGFDYAPWDTFCLTFSRFPAACFAARPLNLARFTTSHNSKGGRYAFPRSVPRRGARRGKPHFCAIFSLRSWNCVLFYS